MTTSETEARRKREAAEALHKIQQALDGLEIETKRLVVTEIDRLVSFEESSHVAAERLQ